MWNSTLVTLHPKSHSISHCLAKECGLGELLLLVKWLLFFYQTLYAHLGEDSARVRWFKNGKLYQKVHSFVQTIQSCTVLYWPLDKFRSINISSYYIRHSSCCHCHSNVMRIYLFRQLNSNWFDFDVSDMFFSDNKKTLSLLLSCCLSRSVVSIFVCVIL